MMFRVETMFISTVPCRATSHQRCSGQGPVVEPRGNRDQTSSAAARETTPKKSSGAFAGNDSKEVRNNVEKSHNFPFFPLQKR